MAPSELTEAGKKQRSRRGCLTCRSRKVKCDERPGTCQNCSRLSLECVWKLSRQVQRSRINKACNPCRQRKTRCFQLDESSPSCEPCRQAGFICSTQTLPSHNPSQTSELRVLIDLFFQGPYHFFYFSHVPRRSFYQMLDSDLMPRYLLLIMCATVQRIRDPSGPADAWAEESRHLVMQGLFSSNGGKLSTASLMTLLMLQRFEENRGEHLKAWLLSGLAIRLAHALHLNTEHEHPPLIVRENRRRVMWSCVVMDSLMEAGVAPISGLDFKQIRIRLPCDSMSFHRGDDSPDVTVNMDDPEASLPPFRHSLDAQLIVLGLLRLEIVKYTFDYHARNQDNLPTSVPWDQDAKFFVYKARLDAWAAQLPDEFTLTRLRTDNPESIKILDLHCLFHGAYCDLLRIGALITSLPETAFPRAPEVFLTFCARDLLEHAFAIATGISETFDRLPFCDSYTAICGCLSLRLLILDRRPSERDFIPLSDPATVRAIEGTTRCLQHVSRWSEPIKRYFCAVHDMCLKRGHPLKLTENLPAAQETTMDFSRPPSPSLRTYGIFGCVSRELDDNTTVTSMSPEHEEAGPSWLPQYTDADTMHFMSPIPTTVDNSYTDEAIRTLSGWIDGTYDTLGAQGFLSNDSFNLSFAMNSNMSNTGAFPYGL